MQRIRNRQLIRDAELYASMGSNLRVGLGTKLSSIDWFPTTDLTIDLVREREMAARELPQDVINQLEQDAAPYVQRRNEINDYIQSQARRGFTIPDAQRQELRDEAQTLSIQIEQLRTDAVNQQIELGKIRTPEDLNEAYKEYGYEFKEPMGQERVDYIINRQIERQTRQALMERGPTGIVPGVLTFGATLASFAVDPLELASAFVPVVGPAKYAGWIRKSGKYVGRLRKGFVEGTAGALMTEPLYVALGNQTQMDISMIDSLMNVGIGSVLGSGIGLVGGRFSRGTAEQQAARIERRYNRASYNDGYLSETARLALNQGLLTGKVDIVNLDARGSIPIVTHKGINYQSINSLPDKLKEDLQPVVIRTDAKGEVKIYSKKGNAERVKGEGEEVIPYQQTLLTPAEAAEGFTPVSGYIIVKRIPGEIAKKENGKVLTFKTKEEAMAAINADPLMFDPQLKTTLGQVVEIPTARGKEYGIAINMAKDDVDLIGGKVKADSVIIRSGVDATQRSALKDLNGGIDSIVYGKEADKVISNRVNERIKEEVHPDDLKLIEDETKRLEQQDITNIDDSIKTLQTRIDELTKDADDAVLKVKEEIDEVIANKEQFNNSIDEIIEEGIAYLSGGLTMRTQALQKMKDAFIKLTGAKRSIPLIEKIEKRLRKTIDQRLSREVDRNAPLSRDLIDEINEEGIKIANELKADFKQEVRQHLLQLLKYENLRKRSLKAYEITGDVSLGIESALVEIPQFFEGAGIGASQIGATIKKAYISKLMQRLVETDLLDLWRNLTPDDSRALTDVIQQINREIPVPRENLRTPVSDNIYKLAQIISKFNNEFRLRKNNAGANIKDLQGYITRQTHNKSIIQKNKDEWLAMLKDKLDFEKMGVANIDIDEFLEIAYVNIISPPKLNTSRTAASGLYELKDLPSNLANRLQQERIFVFKSGADWFDYNQQFGRIKSFQESFMLDLEATARQVGLLETFGPNPGYILDRLKIDLKNEFRTIDEQQVNNLDRNGKGKGNRLRPKLETYLDYVSGYTNVAENELFAETMQGIRLLQTMAKLGSAVITSISDVMTMTSQQRSLGNGLGKSLSNAFSALYVGLVAKKDLKNYGEFVAIGLENMLGSYMSRMGATDSLNGRMSRSAEKYFKLNLLKPWTENAKTGIAMIIARDIAKQSSRKWTSVDGDLRAVLERYNITKSNWDIVRKAVKTYPDGKNYISPAKFDELGLSQKTADELKFNLITLLDNESSIAVPTPGAKVQTIVTGGYRSGTWQGEAIRTIMQFKAFPMVYHTQVLGRQRYAYGQSQKKGLKNLQWRGIQGITELAAGMTIAGVFAQQAYELSRGREPKPFDLNLLNEGFLRSGAAGLYGDFLFSRAAAYGEDPLIGMLGPTVGTLSDLTAIGFGYTAFGAEADRPRELLRLASNNIPGVNLFYLREAANYLFFYQMQEMLNPGYLRRVEERVEQEGQEYIFKPSRHVVYNDGKYISNVD